MGETVPLDFVSRWSGLSPWVVLWPLQIANAASRAREAALRACSGLDLRQAPSMSCDPRRHPSAGHVLSNRGMAKPADGSDAEPSGGVRWGWVGRSRGRHPFRGFLWLPPEMETPAFGGYRDRRCERPVQLRSTSFHGQVESAESRGAFRLMRGAVELRIATCPQIPAVRGGSAERRLPIVIRLSPRGAMVPRLRWNGAASHALFQLSPQGAMFPV